MQITKDQIPDTIRRLRELLTYFFYEKTPNKNDREKITESLGFQYDSRILKTTIVLDILTAPHICLHISYEACNNDIVKNIDQAITSLINIQDRQVSIDLKACFPELIALPEDHRVSFIRELLFKKGTYSNVPDLLPKSGSMDEIRRWAFIYNNQPKVKES